jgi:Putative bacterial sensory transduction regulator
VSAAPAGRDSAEREYPAEAAAKLGDILSDLEVSFTSPQPGAFLVRLEGQHKLVTMTWLIADTHSLHVEAFFCRQPDENHAEFYRLLLERGSRMFGIHFALDQVGDVHLVGRLPLAMITTDEIDRLLGCVLSYSDDNFDQALMIGFASSIRREYAWRVKRGESLANLRAFTRLTEPEASSRPVGPEASSRPAGPEAHGPS